MSPWWGVLALAVLFALLLVRLSVHEHDSPDAGRHRTPGGSTRYTPTSEETPR